MMQRCELMLYEHTGPCADPKHTEALHRRRMAGAGRWEAIVRGEDGGGWRDFLDGRAIHCGDLIDLQAIKYRGDNFGSYAEFLDEGITVRYEANLSSADGPVTLYTLISSHEFRARLEAWMRFRWPK